MLAVCNKHPDGEVTTAARLGLQGRYSSVGHRCRGCLGLYGGPRLRGLPLAQAAVRAACPEARRGESLARVREAGLAAARAAAGRRLPAGFGAWLPQLITAAADVAAARRNGPCARHGARSTIYQRLENIRWAVMSTAVHRMVRQGHGPETVRISRDDSRPVSGTSYKDRRSGCWLSYTAYISAPCVAIPQLPSPGLPGFVGIVLSVGPTRQLTPQIKAVDVRVARWSRGTVVVENRVLARCVGLDGWWREFRTALAARRGLYVPLDAAATARAARREERRDAARRGALEKIEHRVAGSTLAGLVLEHPGLLISVRHALLAGACAAGLKKFRRDYGLSGRSARLDVLYSLELTPDEAGVVHRAACAALLAEEGEKS